MHKTITKIPKDVSMRTDELMRIFRASESVLEAIEDVLEQRAMYSSEFLRGLDTSLKETKQGKIHKIASLADVM